MIIRLNEYIKKRFLHPTSSGINNVPSLDGVRGLAILMVIICHLFAHSVDTGGGFPFMLKIGESAFDIKQLLLNGSHGVRLFFVLSGFLLFIPYGRAHLNDTGKVNTKQFYRRRAMRILPAYLLIILAFSLLMLISYGGSLNRINILLNVFFIHPFFSFRNDVGPDFIPGTWSLVTEVHFYLLLPFIAWFFNSFKKGALTTLLLMALSIFYRASVAAYVTSPGVSFILGHNIFAHIDQFALGMFAALIYVKLNNRAWNIPPAVTYMLVITGIFIYWCISHGGLSYIKDYETLLGLSFSLFILGVVTGPSPVRSLMEWGPLRLVGLISYSMFLINVVVAIYLLKPLMNMLSIINPFHRLAFNMTIGVIILVVISILSYLYVERPFLVKKVNPMILSGTQAEPDQIL